MAERRITLAANTWLDLATVLVGTDMGGHLILRATGADFQIAVKASTAPGVDGTAMPVGAAVEVIYAANAAVKVWVRSTAGGVLEVDDIGGKTVVVAASAVVA